METGRLIAILIFSVLIYIVTLRTIILFAVKSATSEEKKLLNRISKTLDAMAKDQGVIVKSEYDSKLYGNDAKNLKAQ